MTPLDADFVALLETTRERVWQEAEALNKILVAHKGELPAPIDELWSGFWGALHDAVVEVSCHHCDECVATVPCGLDGNRCEACAERLAA
jgi:hypothetical protein